MPRETCPPGALAMNCHCGDANRHAGANVRRKETKSPQHPMKRPTGLRMWSMFMLQIVLGAPVGDLGSRTEERTTVDQAGVPVAQAMDAQVGRVNVGHQWGQRCTLV